MIVIIRNVEMQVLHQEEIHILRGKMKTKQQIEDLLTMRVESLKVLSRIFWQRKGNKNTLGECYKMQEQVEDLCWILDIEPITKYNVV